MSLRLRPGQAAGPLAGVGEETLLLPEERLLSREAVEHLRDVIAQLPLAQQAVIGLRDVEGFSAEEVVAALDIRPGNERCCYTGRAHAARARIRRPLLRASCSTRGLSQWS